MWLIIIASQPVKCAEALGCVSVFGTIDDSAALFKICHPLLGKLAADYVMGKALQGVTIIRRYRLAYMDVEAAVMPRQH